MFAIGNTTLFYANNQNVPKWAFQMNEVHINIKVCRPEKHQIYQWNITIRPTPDWTTSYSADEVVKLHTGSNKVRVYLLWREKVLILPLHVGNPCKARFTFWLPTLLLRMNQAPYCYRHKIISRDQLFHHYIGYVTLITLVSPNTITSYTCHLTL